MRCYICDAVIPPDDVNYDVRYENEKYGPFTPCAACCALIDEAFEDEDPEEFILEDDYEENPAIQEPRKDAG